MSMGVYIIKRENAGRRASPGRPKRRPFTSYHLRWGRGVEGPLHLGTTTNEAEALRWKQRAEDRISLGGKPDPSMFNGGKAQNGERHVEPARRTLRQAAEAWHAARERDVWNGKSATAKNNRGYMNRVVGFFGDWKYPADITREDVKRFYAKMQEAELTPPSIRNFRVAAAGIWDFEAITPNPWREKAISSPTYGGGSNTDPLPTDEQMAAAAALLSPVDFITYGFQRHGGMRPSEALRARWDHITVRDGVHYIYLPETKGSNDKTGKINKRTVHVMRFQRAAGIEWIPTPAEGATGRINPTTVGGFLKRLHNACDEAKVPWFNSNILRKVHATELEMLRAKRVVDMTDKQYEGRLGHTREVAGEHYIRDTGEDF